MRFLSLAMICLLAACGDDEGAVVVPDAAPLAPTSKLDVLILMDNSGGMPGEQFVFASALPALFDRLTANGPADLSLHLAVATSTLDIGVQIEGADACEVENGHFFNGLQAPCLSEGDFIVSEPGSPPNFTGTLVEAAGCLVQAGAGGCGFEQHLEGIRQALDNPNNADFLRDDAALLLIIAADEDDCSASGPALFDPIKPEYGPVESFRCTEYGVRCAEGAIRREVAEYTDCEPDFDSALMVSPAVYRDFLVEKKGDSRRAAVVGLGAPDAPYTVHTVTNQNTGTLAWRLGPSCPGLGFTDPYGMPTVRINWFAEQFPIHSLGLACAEDYSPMLQEAADLALAAMGH